MSKKVVSLAVILLLLSTLVQAQDQLPVSSTGGAVPAGSKRNVELVSRWPLPADTSHLVHDLAVQADHAYVGGRYEDQTTGQLTVVDVSNPAQPTGKDHVQAYYGESVYVVQIGENLVHTIENDAQNPHNPTIRVYEKAGLQPTCSDLLFADRVVDLWIGLYGFRFAVTTGHAESHNRLLVFAGGDPILKDCKIATTLSLGSNVSSAAYADKRVYLGTDDGRLIVVDVSSVTAPTVRSRTNPFFSGAVEAIAAAPGNAATGKSAMAYLAHGQDIKAIDVSNPSVPQEFGSAKSQQPVTEMVAAGDFLYAASEQGLEIFDVQFPSSPDPAGHYLDENEKRFGNALFVVKDLIYAGGEYGMSILRFTPGARAAIEFDATGMDVQVNGQPAPAACQKQALGHAGGRLSSSVECELKEGDRITFTSPQAGVNLYARCTDAASPSLVGSARIAGEGGAASVQTERIQAAAICNRVPPDAERETASPALGTAAAELAIAHESGALRYSFVPAGLPVEVRTGAATVQSTGANDLGVARDPGTGATAVSCYKGSVGVQPTNAALPPVTLQTGQGVEVTSEKVGPVTVIGYPVYLPLTVRNTDVGPAGGWTTLLREDFEGAFPGSWMVADGGSGLGEHHWGSRTCRPHGGGRSAWAVGGGADGAALACGSNYPGSVESWMAAGPFDLSDATAAEVRFQRWVNADPSERLSFGASADGASYQLIQDSGPAGAWQEVVYDLANAPGLGDLMGDRDVWFAFVFSSDASGSLPEGVYVDDVHVRKYFPAAGVVQSAPVTGARRAGPEGTEGMTPVRWVRPGAEP